MKSLIIGILLVILSSSTVFALDYANERSAINQAYPRTVAAEELARTTPPIDLDDLPDLQDLHNLDSIYQNNLHRDDYPYYGYGYGNYPYSLERRAVIIPGPSVDRIDSMDDVEHNVYIHTERPR